MNIRPLNDRVVIRRMEEETTSAGGIVLPGSATEKPVEGEVIAVGKNCEEVAVGDKVLFGKFSGNEVKVGGQEVLVMREEDIMGVIEG